MRNSEGPPGGVVNPTLKSGTNRLHGSMYEFLRNNKLEARNFFDLDRRESRTVNNTIRAPRARRGDFSELANPTFDPLTYTFGNLGRNTELGPSYENVDFAMMKQTTLFTTADQPWSLQFRWEFFNIFNHTNFGFPGNSLGTPAFGQLTNASPGRKMQVGLKLVF